MIAEIQKLETAARIAMAHFEGPDAAAPRPRSRLPYQAFALLLLLAVVAALASALL